MGERSPPEMFKFAIGAPHDDDTRPAPGRDDGAPAHPGDLLPSAGETMREFPLTRAEVDRLCALKEAVYGKPVDRAVLDWHYFGHPRSADFRLFGVEEGGALIASTTRMPVSLRLDGALCPTYFNIDSMVHPAHRRKGCMRDLYKTARRAIDGSPIFFSKGSSASIYPLLVSIGHQPLTPNTTLVWHPSAARWLMSRLHLVSPARQRDARILPSFEDFLPFDRFGDDFDAFFDQIASQLPAVFFRDAAFMNWRYVDIPHRRYLRYARTIAGRMTGVVVIAVHDGQANVVDVLWDPSRKDEPLRTVRFAQALGDEHRVVRVTCFATHRRLRQALSDLGFIDRGETPRFSAFVPEERRTAFTRAADLHVVDGDGDTEFS